ncbi:hypothetical protein ACETK8_03005 [Brevundimonas staleyi]|uniref:Uncharacterized protein n=1 Tax=Brevundimonas staleyi TaxID=74326 RepID=A0ABW0FW34_9CAUL
MTLLGLALYSAQRVEFALYGIAAHASHTPAAQRDRRFSKLSGEKFLRGDPSELKATLGQLVTIFGDAFLIRTPELIDFYERRNLIAHDFYRHFHLRIGGAVHGEDPSGFLLKFIEDAKRWQAILMGLMFEFMEGIAKRDGRLSELQIGEQDRQNMAAYREHAEAYAQSRASEASA